VPVKIFLGSKSRSLVRQIYVYVGLTISIKQLQTVLDAVVCLLTFRLLQNRQTANDLPCKCVLFTYIRTHSSHAHTLSFTHTLCHILSKLFSQPYTYSHKNLCMGLYNGQHLTGHFRCNLSH